MLCSSYTSRSRMVCTPSLTLNALGFGTFTATSVLRPNFSRASITYGCDKSINHKRCTIAPSLAGEAAFLSKRSRELACVSLPINLGESRWLRLTSRKLAALGLAASCCLHDTFTCHL